MMRIVLVCYAGMSTSMLVARMQKVAQERGLEAEIEAIAASELEEVGDADVILLGPQARYALDEVKKIADEKGIKVDVINSMLYGTMNGSAVLDMALGMMEK